VRVAFATCSAMPDGYADDQPVARELGADYRIWDDPRVDWQSYDRVVIRSTWDYTDRLEEFVSWVERVGAERLRNQPELVRFNVDKRYLAELATATVPTQLLAPGETAAPALDGEVVVKPNVSAGARDTGRFGPATHALALELIERIRESGRVALVQPYLPAIDTEGERAYVFIGGRYSHALRKHAVLRADEIAPTTEDELDVATAMLREDLVVAAEPDPLQLRFAENVMQDVSARFGTPLYVRVDLVMDGAQPLLLELEAVEPTLYMETAPGSTQRFATAILAS
jgi:glutathione synthase/RimK-type ligase-like ATP-grasp enzyme